MIIPTFRGGYEKDFYNHLVNAGHKVYTCKANLSGNDYTLFDHLLGRINNKHYVNKNFRYLEKQIEKLKGNKIDRVILFYGATFYTPELIDKFRNAFKKAKFIYYIWDSFCNFPHIESIYKKFDVCYSFSRIDADNYNLRYLPLFYPTDPIEGEIEQNYFIVSTFWPTKKDNYLRIKNALPPDMVGKEHLYMPKKRYLFTKFFHPGDLSGLDKKNIKTYQLSREEVYSLMASSKVILNCPFGKQNGIGFGIMEALRLERKVITTIKAIEGYDFYTPDNIFVVDENTKSIPKSFFDTPFNKDYRLSDNYSPENFVKQLLSD